MMHHHASQQHNKENSRSTKQTGENSASAISAFQRISSTPQTMTSDDILHLQRTIGNEATQNLLVQRANLDSPEESLAELGEGMGGDTGSLWTLIYAPNSRHFKVRFNRGMVPESKKAFYRATTRKDVFKRKVRKNRVITGAEWVDKSTCLLYVKKTSDAAKDTAHNVEIWKFDTKNGNYIEPANPVPILSENRVNKKAAQTFMGGVDNLRDLDSIEDVADGVFDSVRGGQVDEHLLKYTSDGDPDAIRKVFGGELDEAACHALAMTFATVVNAIAAAAGIGDRATYIDKDRMLVTKPDLVTLGKGNVSNITQHLDKDGDAVENSQVKGHRIIFTSHSWAIVNGKIYDLALGIKGGATSGVDEDTFGNINQESPSKGENANYTFASNADGSEGFSATWTVKAKE